MGIQQIAQRYDELVLNLKVGGSTLAVAEITF